MIAALEDRREGIAEICRQYGVRRLEVFGSAADDTYDPQRSDVDFLVEFPPGEDLGPGMTRYFALKEALESLLGSPVDLVMLGSPGLQDPYFSREANRTRRLLYAA